MVLSMGWMATATNGVGYMGGEEEGDAVQQPEVVDEAVVDVERAVHDEGEEAAVRVEGVKGVWMRGKKETDR